MKQRILSVLILFGMALLVMPVAKNNDVISLDRIHTDSHRIIDEPKGYLCPSNLVMRVKVPIRSDMEERAALQYAADQFVGNHLYKVQEPPIAAGSAEKAALEEAVKNLPRQYASPAARPKRPCPPACGQEHIVAVVK
jgi:hypothetical protein